MTIIRRGRILEGRYEGWEIAVDETPAHEGASYLIVFTSPDRKTSYDQWSERRDVAIDIADHYVVDWQPDPAAQDPHVRRCEEINNAHTAAANEHTRLSLAIWDRDESAAAKVLTAWLHLPPETATRYAEALSVSAETRDTHAHFLEVLSQGADDNAKRLLAQMDRLELRNLALSRVEDSFVKHGHSDGSLDGLYRWSGAIASFAFARRPEIQRARMVVQRGEWLLEQTRNPPRERKSDRKRARKAVTT